MAIARACVLSWDEIFVVYMPYCEATANCTQYCNNWLRHLCGSLARMLASSTRSPRHPWQGRRRRSRDGDRRADAAHGRGRRFAAKAAQQPPAAQQAEDPGVPGEEAGRAIGGACVQGDGHRGRTQLCGVVARFMAGPPLTERLITLRPAASVCFVLSSVKNEFESS